MPKQKRTERGDVGAGEVPEDSDPANAVNLLTQVFGHVMRYHWDAKGQKGWWRPFAGVGVRPRPYNQKPGEVWVVQVTWEGKSWVLAARTRKEAERLREWMVDWGGCKNVRLFRGKIEWEQMG